MISLNQANTMISAAIAKAIELGTAISVSVVDDGGNLIAFSRMDNAIKISQKFSHAKAYTSGSLGMPTEMIAPFAVDGKPYAGLHSLFGGELSTIAGGIPIMIEGKLAGGIGCGGSTDVNQDAECAKAGVAAIQ